MILMRPRVKDFFSRVGCQMLFRHAANRSHASCRTDDRHPLRPYAGPGVTKGDLLEFYHSS